MIKRVVTFSTNTSFICRYTNKKYENSNEKYPRLLGKRLSSSIILPSKKNKFTM
jgi:hypothetical protein